MYDKTKTTKTHIGIINPALLSPMTFLNTILINVNTPAWIKYILNVCDEILLIFNFTFNFENPAKINIDDSTTNGLKFSTKLYFSRTSGILNKLCWYWTDVNTNKVIIPDIIKNI